MSEKLIKILDKFCHDLSIAELQSVYQKRESADLSYHDTLYLNIIAAHPYRYTASQIADLLKVSRPAITQKINELSKKGYIIRKQSPTDKRLFYLAPNEQKDYFMPEHYEKELKVSKMIIEKFGMEQFDQLCIMLEFLSDALYNEKVLGEKNDQ